MTYFQTHASHVAHTYIQSLQATNTKPAILQGTRAIPRHAVLLLFSLKPALQLAHIDAW